MLHPAVDLYVCSYGGELGGRWGALHHRLELGVNLGTGWSVKRRAQGPAQSAMGSIYAIAPGELYDVEYGISGTPGISVLFAVDLPALLEDPSVQIQRRTLIPCARLEDLARQIAWRACAGLGQDAHEIVSALKEYLGDACDTVVLTPMELARREIEAHCDAGLYLRNIAETAHMHPTTFLRYFGREYGVTPIQYRLRIQMERAARVAWLNPSASIEEVAAETGISHVPYFFRQFKRHFGTTPAQHRRQEAPRSSASALAR